MFTFKVVTASGIDFSGEVEEVNAKTVNGQITILTNHVPTLDRLAPSELRFKDAKGKTFKSAITGGWLVVKREETVVITRDSEFDFEIDLDKAKEDYQRAHEQLKNANLSHAERRRAQANLEIASARINVSKK